MKYGVAETARILGIDIQQLKTWAYQFRDNLSALANPEKGTPRIFTTEDVLVLLYVSHFWEDEPDVEAIVAGLNSGYHHEDIYVHSLWNHTPLIQDDVPENLSEPSRYGLLISPRIHLTQIEIARSYHRAANALWDNANDSGFPMADCYPVMQPEDLKLWYVRNTGGEMVPFTTFSSGHWSSGSPRLERFNGNSAVEIVGEAAPGNSSGDAMRIVGEIVSKLPAGIGYEWTGASFQEQQAGAQAPALYAISILVVFLCLAALYESWSVPFSVILAVPLGVLGALAAAYFRGMENDVYFQVGLLTTIGLSAKNAILIVEFAKQRYDKGAELIDATISACRVRLRPILMTSMAFMLGVLPLAISTGAGANSRHAIGTGVLGGMLSATVLAVVFIPLFFVLVLRIFKTKRAQLEETSSSLEV